MDEKNRKEIGKMIVSPRSGAAVPVRRGRPKGVKNKLSRLAKDNIAAVYENLGGVEGHVKFLRTHLRALERFYTEVYPKLLTQGVELSGQVGLPDNQLVIKVVETKE
jgi:hypothetical protein